LATLEQNFETIWQETSRELTEAVKRGRHPWHLMTLATISPTGLPQARTVVLRRFESSLPALFFHTDYRSPKVQELRESAGKAQLLLYSPESKRQLRCDVTINLHHEDALTRTKWDEARDSSRRCYLVNPAPSANLTERSNTLPETWQKTVPTKEEAASGYPNFTVAECRIHRADILQLNAQGGERCALEFSNDGTIQSAEWLAP
jgi:hypothetical protein